MHCSESPATLYCSAGPTRVRLCREVQCCFFKCPLSSISDSVQFHPFVQNACAYLLLSSRNTSWLDRTLTVDQSHGLSLCPLVVAEKDQTPVPWLSTKKWLDQRTGSIHCSRQLWYTIKLMLQTAAVSSYFKMHACTLNYSYL